MSNSPERIPSEKTAQLYYLENNKKKRGGFWERNGIIITALFLCLIFAAIGAYLTIDMITVGASVAGDAYITEKENRAEEVYQQFYQRSYEIAEKKHHVSNKTTITIGTLREQAKIEVLKVSDVEYVTEDKLNGNWLKDLFVGNLVSWLEVPGHGVFTVDLQSGEFIIDDDRQYVLIRVPTPALTEFTIETEHVEVLYFNDSGIFDHSTECGVDTAEKQLKSAHLTMLQEMSSNQTFYSLAQENTRDILTNLVKQLNPDKPDLIVEVEFMDLE